MKKYRKTLVLVFAILVLPNLLHADSFTELAMKAGELKIGMPREKVVELLGPPDWAIIPADREQANIKTPSAHLQLFWNNPDCAPVVVSFNFNYLVSDWDDGSDFCGPDAKTFNPTQQYSCQKPDRADFCR